MHTVIYVFRRVPGMSLDEFREYYEKKHGPRMVELMKDRGLVAYDQYPIRDHGVGDEYVPVEGPAYDAVSVFTFVSAEAASAIWPVPEIIEDSKAFIDFDTMLMLPVTPRTVFPRSA
jgi:hypothetical protein